MRLTYILRLSYRSSQAKCVHKQMLLFFSTTKNELSFLPIAIRKEERRKKYWHHFISFFFFHLFFSILFAQKFDGDNLHWRVPFISSIKQTMCTCTYCACIHEHIYWNLAAWANLYDWTRAPKKNRWINENRFHFTESAY